eukprot:CAMPEP_0201573382 /NCGR_PEP_ID=MMETSP0190_2-20130828/17210_1 /ASSEMBLY_ACC=CAM_ASM_000263 /TAXON_ID=37353 /ORGANISM="Rosalina sp." /LENGTH=429 /DNA_ID=CAMNT_0048000307 /DNA_START=230 /DNA_END=1519 /DNA_ORIENTATION=-
MKQFQLSSDSNLAIYQSPIDKEQDETINLNTLHEYDTQNTDMSKIKHKYVFCIKEIKDSDTSDNNNKVNLDYQSNQKRLKKKRRKHREKQKRKQKESDSESSSNSNNSSNSTDEDSENKEDEDDEIIIDVNERDFGLDLDVFDRFPTSKKPQSSKKNAKPVYHYHPQTQIRALSYNLKETWLNLKTHPLTVKHIDDKYTMMQDENKQFNLRCRRIIWPRNLQHMKDEFKYNLTDISSKWIWAILIIHGGKFAGAIYHGNKMILHKTLRRYVIRKGQGKRQVNHLSTSGVKAGSAGGYKRSWNEKKLLEEIREILSLWMDELSVKCDKIFIHAPGIYNQMTLYGNADEQSYLYPQQNGRMDEDLSEERLRTIKNKNKNKNTNLYRLYKKDERITQIPITTHGVTLKECERVHYWLSTSWLGLNKNTDNDD